MESLTPWIGLVAAIMTAGAALLGRRMSIQQRNDEWARENATEVEAEKRVMEMLEHGSHTQRAFEAISNAIGALNDDALRRILVKVGGICVKRKDGSEWWHLASRHDQLINKHRAREERSPYRVEQP